ncbi:MAG: DNA primase [Ruminococcus sp.]|nr:DNA primase [Ruminococcus sp.]
MNDKTKETNTRNNFPDWLTDESKVNELKFCQYFTGIHPLKCIDGRFYDFDGLVGENSLENEIYQLLRLGISTGLAKRTSNLLESLRLYAYSQPVKPDLEYIHVQNGKLDLKGNFYPYKEFCGNRLNIWYDPEIRKGVYYPEKFLSFLLELLDPKDIDTLQEYLGYLLIPSTKGQKMMFIIGQGGEGKSRIAIVLREIFGDSMITGNFQRIETDKFFRYNLKDKLLMIDDDMQMSALPSTGYIKSLVTAEVPTDIEAKGKQSEQSLLYTRLLCFGNGSPKALYDKSKGFSRRMLIITVKPKSPNRIDDPHIADKFIAEKDKIFCWIYDGLIRLINNNYKFTISEKAKLNIKEAVQDNCNIADFLSDSDRTAFGANISVSSSRLYNAYYAWCEDNALTALKRDTFISWIKQNETDYNIKYDCNIPNGNSHVRGFKGIAVK